MIIIVNGRTRLVGETSGLTLGDPSGTGHLSYGDIVQQAGYARDRVLSVTYCTRRKDDQRREGSLCPGESTRIEEGMIFDVADTSNA